jgi:hypothetical protein
MGNRQMAEGNAAFTLIEILVTMTLLAFIVLGLFAAFDQVQRAFLSSMNQVDRLEAGRAVTEMLPREFEQAAASGRNAVNFCAQVIPNCAPLTQSLPGTAVQRTNLLEDCFLLLRQNQTWIGIGYCVRIMDAKGGLQLPETGSGSGQLGSGALYRWSASTNVLRSDIPNVGLPSDPSQLYRNFYNACYNLPGPAASRAISNRICDGVIYFSLQASATNGFPIVGDGVHTNAYFRTNAVTLGYTIVHPARAIAAPYPGNVAGLCFWSNAVPAAVELQLGILEQRALERYNSIGNPAARLAYLQRSETTSRIQLFRQRVPIRNVDPLAYQ